MKKNADLFLVFRPLNIIHLGRGIVFFIRLFFLIQWCMRLYLDKHESQCKNREKPRAMREKLEHTS